MRLQEQKEWCGEQSCCGGREASAVSARRWISRLFGCSQQLAARSQQRLSEWSEITSSVSGKSDGLLSTLQLDGGIKVDEFVAKMTFTEIVFFSAQF